MEIHDEIAAQIANSTEEVEYIDGVSSIMEEDEDEASETKSVDETKGKAKDEKDADKEEEEVQVDTFRVIGIRKLQGECLVSVKFISRYQIKKSFYLCKHMSLNIRLFIRNSVLNGPFTPIKLCEEIFYHLCFL